MSKLIFFFLFTSLVQAARLELTFDAPEVKQGELVRAHVSVDAASLQKLPLIKLRGQTLADTLYLYSLEPLTRAEGSNIFRADVKVLFAKVPDSTILRQTVENEPVEIELKAVKVIATKVPPQLIFGEFEIPRPLQLLKWFLGLLGLLALGFGGFKLHRRYRKRKEVKHQRIAMKKSLSSCTSADEVIALWKRKRELLETFPVLETPFANLEKTLFRSIFKPSQSEGEKTQILEAYREFTKAAEGELRGV